MVGFHFTLVAFVLIFWEGFEVWIHLFILSAFIYNISFSPLSPLFFLPSPHTRWGEMDRGKRTEHFIQKEAVSTHLCPYHVKVWSFETNL